MPATYEPISTQTLGSNVSSISFTSIPSTYKDLVLVSVFNRSAADTGSWFRINNDTGTNYSTTNISGYGTSVVTGRDSNVNVGRYFRNLANQTTYNFIMMNFIDYANTARYKTIITKGGNPSGTYSGVERNVNLWRSTSAINRIDLILSSGTYNSGSIVTLYGIKAA